jgi:hypothetical protein
LFLTLLHQAGAQSFLNPSFESWANPNACDVNLAPDNWLEYSNAGIGVDEADFSFCPTTIPPAPADGNIYARSYGATPTSGEGFYQVPSGFTVGVPYMITFNYAGSNLYGGTDPIKWHIFIDDADVDSTPVFQSTDAVWMSHSYTFISSNSSHKIGFRLYSTTTSPGSGAIDHIDLSQSNGMPHLNGIRGITVFPTAVSDMLTIDLNGAGHVQASILNSLGQKVMNCPLQGEKMQVDVSALQKGIYFLRVSDEKEVVVKRFVKE